MRPNLAMLTATSEIPRLPSFVYGTAWKEGETQRLTELALQQGFRGIDTANQRRHYYEEAVGNGIAVAIKSGLVVRDELFLQTKFTFRRGQDHRLPYDPEAGIPVQVEQSFASSLQHLSVEQIDSYLLHGPTQRTGLAPADWATWRAMEAILESGRARMLGVSNVTAEQLRTLCQDARVQPRFVQNRCYADQGWDRAVREFCHTSGITYQGFSLLTTNRATMAHPDLARIAKRHDRTPSQIVFRFAIHIGILPLTGTTSATHMREDLTVLDFQLDEGEVRCIESISG